MTFSSGGPPFVALVSLSNKGEIQYTGVDARWSAVGEQSDNTLSPTKGNLGLVTLRTPRVRASRQTASVSLGASLTADQYSVRQGYTLRC